ncbi:hypothetical protein H6F86_31180 [Phormidium sp. FACHB-592]|uniref:Uncharacterized protein n=1 Tax=Stenomitos frigidus AS-A4 TaxID=2933935 RepID=A0ABV0KTJ6_9CYAN|nr:hypothetical protein [Phormidium sp. FACHB-592]MBD2078275.1 hypothetical protein [Phormidium sp. FACHB-592]
MSDPTATAFEGCTSGCGLKLDFFDSKSGSKAVFFPVFNACKPDAAVAPLLRGATVPRDQSL